MRVQRAVDVAGLLGHDDDAVALLVDRQRHAEAVEDAAALRGQQPQVDAVFLGQDLVFVGLQHLQVIHPRGQRADHARLQPAQQQGAAGQHLEAAFVLGKRARLHRVITRCTREKTQDSTG